MDFDFYRLDNGVRVLLCPMPGVQSVGVGVYIETGSRYESKQINGISHFLEHMVFKGTKNYPTHKDTSKLEGMGAIQNAWTDVDATSYWCKIPSDRWEEGLDLVKDLALYPLIPPNDLEIERGVILEEINRREDRPDEISSEVLMELLYPENALGLTTLGSADVIKNLSREDFLTYHKDQYVAGRLVIVLAGKIDMKAAKNKILEDFGGLPEGIGNNFTKAENLQKSTRTKVYKKDLAAQAHIEMGFYGLTVSDPRRFALSVLTSYLGRGLSSRLFTELREKRGLCYAVSADEARLTDTGIWSVYAGLNVAKMADAVKAIAGEIGRIKTDKLTEEELSSAKEKIRGPLLFSMENPINVMNFYAKQALDKPEEIMTYDQVINSVMQIDPEDILNVAKDLFDMNKINLAVVGPVEQSTAVKLVEELTF